MDVLTALLFVVISVAAFVAAVTLVFLAGVFVFLKPDES